MPTTLLCILDGFGLNPNTLGNAVAAARKPVIDELFKSSSSTTLITYGERVGLPEGQMGNSEVGHLNIGAGRVVEQWLLRIGRALQGPVLDQSEAFVGFKNSIGPSSKIHVVGLYSDGGVHSHSEHLHLLLKKLVTTFSNTICLHLITDGRDTSPHRALQQFPELNDLLETMPQVQIASISGRFHAMDRDKRWERTELAYQAIANGKGPKIEDVADYLSESYAAGIGDEFIMPACVNPSPIQAEDGLIFWNFREDRMRQIVASLATANFSGFSRSHNLPKIENVLCFTDYDHNFQLPYIFEQLQIRNHLGEYLSGLGLKQLRVAETEKYPHVTYFFNGGIEKEYPGEDREVVPSPRDVKTYDLKPEMSAAGVCERVLNGLRSRKYDLIVVNFANCDMVGHTGVLSAGIKAVETVDECLGKILKELASQHGQAIILADHGNAEQMINYDDGSPHTSHTKYPVPLLIVRDGEKLALREGGALCDVAPTVLRLMGIAKPEEMQGESLVG